MYLVELTDTIAAALEVIAGKYGNGEARRKALKAAGLNPDEVQKCVNDVLALQEKYK